MNYFEDFNKKKFLIALAVFIVISLFVRNFLVLQTIVKRECVLGTTVEIRIISRNKTKALTILNLAFKRIREIELVANYFDPRSELSQINYLAAFGETQISDDFYNIVQSAICGSKQSEVAFDITATSIINSFRNKQRKSPSVAVSYEDIILKKVSDNNYIQFKVKSLELDLGGVAKGYAVDQAVALLVSHNIKNSLISCGSSIYALGKNGWHSWRVGVKSPNNTADIAKIIVLKNQGLSTSGDYEQFYYLDKKRIAHIVNPRKGLISTTDKRFKSVTVVADTATSADILSTAAFVLGKEKSEFLITGNIRLLFLPQE